MNEDTARLRIGSSCRGCPALRNTTACVSNRPSVPAGLGDFQAWNGRRPPLHYLPRNVRHYRRASLGVRAGGYTAIQRVAGTLPDVLEDAGPSWTHWYSHWQTNPAAEASSFRGGTEAAESHHVSWDALYGLYAEMVWHASHGPGRQLPTGSSTVHGLPIAPLRTAGDRLDHLHVGDGIRERCWHRCVVQDCE